VVTRHQRTLQGTEQWGSNERKKNSAGRIPKLYYVKFSFEEEAVRTNNMSILKKREDASHQRSKGNFPNFATTSFLFFFLPTGCS
jgi:hypothetical protein